MSVLADDAASAHVLPGTWRVYRWELAKLAPLWRTRLAALLCVGGPFLFTAVVDAQSTLPTDTLFGRWVQASGYAAPLVVLGFCGLWAFPALTSVVAGDMFSAEDRFGTWKTILTRSASRSQIFAGKVLAAASYTVVLVALLAASSVAAGLLLVGDQALVGLSGQLIAPERAMVLVVASWAIALPPALGFTALGLLFSLATRYGPAGVGLPVLVGLVMQLIALVNGPVLLRMLLLTTPFTAWQGLFSQEPFYGPLVWAMAVSTGYLLLALGTAYLLLRRREITAS